MRSKKKKNSRDILCKKGELIKKLFMFSLKKFLKLLQSCLDHKTRLLFKLFEKTGKFDKIGFILE